MLSIWITGSVFFSAISHTSAEDVMVYDTMKFRNLSDWITYPNNGPSSASKPIWTPVNWAYPFEKDKKYVGFTVCSIAEETVDNWVRSPYIDVEGVSQLRVNISFFMRECKEYTGPLHQCRTHFQVLKYESDVNSATASSPSWSDQVYNPVVTVPADVTYISDSDQNIVANNVSFTVTKSSKGFYLALRDRGMCAFVLYVKVFYRRCPATVIRHTDLKSIPATAELQTVIGSCVNNAVPVDPSSQLQFLCTNDGNWFNPSNSRGCVCKKGYTNTATACQACPVGKYKAVANNTECLTCPEHSYSKEPGSASCECLPGYYRGISESADMPCSQPPMPVNQLTVLSVTTDSVSLSWNRPSFIGNRPETDLFYTVRCTGCSVNVIYSPGQTKITVTTVTLTNLVPNTEYRIQILSENSATSSAPTSRPSAEAKIKTLDGPVSKQDSPVKSDATSNSITITWKSIPNAKTYEVRYAILSDAQKAPQSFKVTENQATLTKLEEGSAYKIQVIYFDENGALIGSSSEVVMDTMKQDNSSVVIGVAIAAVLLCMGIVIVIVVIFLRTKANEGTCVRLHKTVLAIFRSRRKCNDKPTNDLEGLGPYSNVPFHITAGTGSQNNMTLPLVSGQAVRGKTYVDPHTYEDPRQAVKEFTKEIDVSCITIEAVIGGGEFGDVCRGKLRLPNKGEMRVAIKTLKPGASEKNRLDFLTEASIMGQFDDANVIFLEGVITKSNPIMIVTEFMENGSLDTFLRANDGKLAVIQLLQMLRGIASGMTYLSEMNYVHRDLAARNILVNEELVCKVADFGLSREVEYDTSEGAYTTRGGKIPVRWTAPEAIAYRKFTSASDVWSFGVVMWEVISYGERPYWNWSNQDVIKAVDRGYRLPPPMDCPEAVHQLMLDCWQKDRKNRPKFAAVRSTLDRLMQSPELLKKLAKPLVQPAFDPDMADINVQMTVSEWLQAIKMDRYTESFAQKGIHTMEQVAWLTFADLLEMGVTLVGHQKKIMSSVQALRSRLDGSASPVQMSDGFLV